jgi:alkaline phosphatase D
VEQLAVGRLLPADLPSEVVPETRTLEQYRLRYALYKSQPEVIAAHQNVPWVTMWDDHEVYNDYEATTEEQILRQAAAYRPYWEHMPLRLPQLPQGPDARLYRRLAYGDLAQFDLLDARQYRSPELTPATIPDSPARRDPARSILGAEQEQWFGDGLRNSRARWNIVPQGVLMAMVNTRGSADPALPPTYSAGNWDGYQASQKRVFGAVAAARQTGSVSNFVVLTGDVHCGYVSELPSNLNEPTSQPIGTEFTNLSITSAQDFSSAANQARQIRNRGEPADEMGRSALRLRDRRPQPGQPPLRLPGSGPRQPFGRPGLLTPALRGGERRTPGPQSLTENVGCHLAVRGGIPRFSGHLYAR